MARIFMNLPFLASLFNIPQKGVPQNVHTVDGRNPAPLCNHGTPLSVGIYRGIESFQGVLGGAKWISQPSTGGSHFVCNIL